jgi:hypothetical protein
MDAIATKKEAKPRLSTRDITFAVLSLLVTIALCVVAIYYKDYLLGMAALATCGLLGMLIVAFLSGSLLNMLVVPVLYWPLVFTLPPILAAEYGIGAKNLANQRFRRD